MESIVCKKNYKLRLLAPIKHTYRVYTKGCTDGDSEYRIIWVKKKTQNLSKPYSIPHELILFSTMCKP
jgi:hypothetical protein